MLGMMGHAGHKAAEEHGTLDMLRSGMFGMSLFLIVGIDARLAYLVLT